MIDPGKVGGAGGEGAVPALGCVRCAHGGSSGVSFPPSISPDLGAVELCEPSTEQLCSSSCAPPAVPPGVGGRSPFQLVMGLRTKSSRCTPPQPSHPPSSSCVAQFGMRDTGCGSGPKRGLRGAVRGVGGGIAAAFSTFHLCWNRAFAARLLPPHRQHREGNPLVEESCRSVHGSLGHKTVRALLIPE